ncbi:MAG: hypothetical protein ACLFQ0_05530, partial [Cyclobacteriaceae bacterium]
MKVLIASTGLLFTLSTTAFAQLGLSFHQSNLPFAGISYGVGERFLPELRLGTDNYFDNTSLELVVNYVFVKKESLQAYGGLGARTQIFDGVLIPLGVNIYPFEQKNFGFHMELAGLFGDGEGGGLLRGSWGIRYRFLK